MSVIQAVGEMLQFGFMRNALATGLLVSIACGVIGTLVVVSRIVFISGGIAHAAYGGVGLGTFLGIDPVWGAVVFSLAAALGMGAVQRKTRERADTLIGVMWTLSMAIGIVLVDLTPGYKAELMGYLFGSILAVPLRDVLMILVLNLLIVLVVASLYKELVATCFDEVFATVEDVPVSAIYLTLLVLVALTVVMLMRVVGLVLVIAMLTFPAAISGRFVKDIRWMMGLASLLGMVFTTAGLCLSFFLNLTSGATIVLVSGTAYLLSLALESWLTRRRVASVAFKG